MQFPKLKGRVESEDEPNPSAPPGPAPRDAPSSQAGSLSQHSGPGLCGAPPPGSGRCGEGWGGAGAVPRRPGWPQSCEYSEFSISGDSLAWKGARPTPKSAGRGKRASAPQPSLAHPGSCSGAGGQCGGAQGPPPPGHRCWLGSPVPAQQPVTLLQDRGSGVRVAHAEQVKPAPREYPGSFGGGGSLLPPPRAVPISASRRPGGGGFLRCSSMWRVISSREALA